MLARVPEATRQAMANLIGQLKGRAISGRDFQTQAIALLGPQMYEELVRKPAAQLAAVHQQQQQAGQQPTGQSQPGQGQQAEEVDVSRMDSAALQDVLKYSNIDLRAESELINRDLHSTSGTAKTSLHSLADPRSRPGHYCNAARLKYIATKVASKAGLPRGIDDEACTLIAIGLQRRITDLLIACIENSRHRVDRGRATWKIRIVNDPRKQLGVLEQAMRARDEKAPAPGDAAKRPRLESSQPQSSQQLQSVATSQQAPAVAASDAAVKAKLANVTAMAAVGLKRKSWMTAIPSSATAPLPANPPSDKPQEQSAMQTEEEPAECPINFAAAPSATALTDKQLFTAFASRTINGRDLTLVIEQDPRLARSSIALLLYDLANSFD